MNYLDPHIDYNTLSLQDLLAARDYFHPQLMHKPNVVGTAVGRYRIRKDDPWPTRKNPTGKSRSRKKIPRTLSNSEVRGYSWPAILVFVQEWVHRHKFGQPTDAIPQTVLMPDGKNVPICVILAERSEIGREAPVNLNYPTNFIGGGYPILADVQGKEHFASIACLVTDGHKNYAMTNRHVAGETGEPIYSILGGNKVEIGVTSTKQLSRKPFEKIYPGWPGRSTYVNQDIGLVEIADLNRWTAQVYGVGALGELADVSTLNLSLRIIGCPVRAHGAASALMQGEVCALFYRYKAVAGMEYIADMLIGPTGGKPLGTRPGDSGTLWTLGDEAPYAPLAVQWGGQVFTEDGNASSYALATFLSNVCNALDVDLVRDVNRGLPDYWGAVGHYTIASRAVLKLGSGNLAKLMKNNLNRISYDTGDIKKKNLQGLSNRDFVPLADVPDMVWKVGPHKRGGMKSPEHANHFADMDRVLSTPLPEGKTLLEICKDPQNVNVSVWQKYYDAVQQQFPREEESRGLLPFRCWQIYDAMVSFVRLGEVENFVAAAGVLAHYVGDSCQPLHISYLFNGNPDHMVPGKVRNPHGSGTIMGKVPEGTGVHSAYEDDMVDHNIDALSARLSSRLANKTKLPIISGGQAAAQSVVKLMQETFAAIKPRAIVDTYVSSSGTPSVKAAALWNAFGTDTVKVMANGCVTLVQLWESAWQEGGGNSTIKSLAAIPEGRLVKIYTDPNFLKAYTLNTIGPVLLAKRAAAKRNPKSKRAKRKKR